ncbi:MAG: transposase [Candidatus Paceibacterota bacterium]
MRKVPFVNNEYYHIFNRGVDKRTVFEDKFDIERFFESMKIFNRVKPVGSILEYSVKRRKDGNFGGRTAKITTKTEERLVDFVSYCLNPNHFHFILRQRSDGGISEFMKRLGGGYTWYFNNKHSRNGALFQGKFKSVHINSNEYLLHLSAYVNLNNRVHNFGGPTAKIIRSSWDEYIGVDNKESKKVYCDKDIILGQFKNKKEYKKFAENSLRDILKNKEKAEELEILLLE